MSHKLFLYLAQKHNHLAVRVGLVAQDVVDERGAGVAVATNGHALVHAVGVARDNVVELVGHAARLGHVRNAAGAVQLGVDDVVHHAARVAHLEAAGLDASHLKIKK